MNDIDTFRSRARHLLTVALLALAGLYLWWFASTPNPWAALAIFALPPALLAVGVLRRHRTAGFWAAVLALGWFSHGVMVAWTRPAEALFAWAALILAVVIVFAASLPGVRARFAKKRG